MTPPRSLGANGKGTSVRKTLRRGAWALSLLASAAIVTGCSSASSGGDSVDPNDTSAPGADALKGKGEVDITFWHAMAGVNGQVLQKLVDQFNQQNKGKIKVTLNFKGQYDTALAAWMQGAGALIGIASVALGGWACLRIWRSNRAPAGRQDPGLTPGS